VERSLDLARARAAISVDVIAVVAFLAGGQVQVAVAADRLRAVGVAGRRIEADGAGVALLDQILDATITADVVELACRAAPVAVLGLIAVFAALADAVDVAVPAPAVLAGAAVAASGIADRVALLTRHRVEQAVAAFRQRAVDVARRAHSGGIAVLAGFLR